MRIKGQELNFTYISCIHYSKLIPLVAKVSAIQGSDRK